MLPSSEQKAIVRIDQSVKINDENLYDCRDADFGQLSKEDCDKIEGSTWHGQPGDSIADCGDWVAGKWTCWHCVDFISNACVYNENWLNVGDCGYYDTNDIDYPNECEKICNEAGYAECSYDLNVINEQSCNEIDGTWSWFIINDVGIDGVLEDPTDDDGDCENCFFDEECSEKCKTEYSIGEKDMMPNCGEPNVDENDEILMNLHVSNCQIKIVNGDSICELEYVDDAATYLYDNNPQGWDYSINNLETPYYSGYVPSNSCTNFNWNDPNGEYEFICDCPGYETIVSESPITISSPVVFYNYSDFFNQDSTINDNFFDASNCNNYDCLLSKSSLWNETSYDTLYFGLNSFNENIYYSSNSPYFYYQSVQYYNDQLNDRYLYLHGHADAATEIESIYNNISLMGERVVTSDISDFIDDIKINKYYYEMFTFSDSYKAYYFFDQLDLRDPVRTNLRIINSEETVMGVFGSMTSAKVYFRLIDCEKYSAEDSSDANITKNACKYYNYNELPPTIQDEFENQLKGECANNICSGGLLEGLECNYELNGNNDCIVDFENIPQEFLNLCGPNNLPDFTN